MIPVTQDLALREEEIELAFVKSSGPGGQNVNKVSSCVQLRFDVLGSETLPEAVRQRLCLLAGKRLTERGVLVIEARRFRTQHRNREDALSRLVALVRRAATPAKRRRRTTPTVASQRRRLARKKRHGVAKQMRRKPDADG